MTEQERKDIIEKYGYPPHVPCGECGAYGAYGSGDMLQDAQVVNYCYKNCKYYKEVVYGLGLAGNGDTNN